MVCTFIDPDPFLSFPLISQLTRLSFPLFLLYSLSPSSLSLPPTDPSLHRPSLSSLLSLLQQVELNSSLISASPDNPEAVLDAIMQVALCEVSFIEYFYFAIKNTLFA